LTPAPETAAGFLFFTNRTAARTSGRLTLPHASFEARRRPNQPGASLLDACILPARANGPVRGVANNAAAAAAPRFQGIGFAPETIAPTAICRAFIFVKETPMTVYLILVAVAGLIVVTIDDVLS
jgi:hypothetical protein